MTTIPAKIETFSLYPQNSGSRPPYVHMKVSLHPYTKPGSAGGPGLIVDVIVPIAPEKDTIAEINKAAAHKVHAAIQLAAGLSLDQVERAISHALEYDENRA